MNYDDIDNLTDSQKLVAILREMKAQGRYVAMHHKILVEGNGELPLREQVRNLNKFVDGLRFWLKTIAVAVVLQTITFAGAAIVYFARLYPVLEKLANQP